MALDYPLSGTVTKEIVKRSQDRLMEMAIVVRDALEKNNIDYIIMFGQMLGSVRNESWIPWDLDFDYGIPEEQYEKAVKAVSEAIPSNWVMQDSNSDSHYCGYWTKVVDRNSAVHSTYYHSDNEFDFKGLHVDMYMLKRTNAEQYERDLAGDNIVYYDLKLKKGLMTKEDHERLTAPINEKLARLKPNDQPKDMYYYLDRKFKESTIFPLKRYTFEHEEFFGPNDSVQFMTDTYGSDYITPPVYEKRDMKIDEILFFD